MIDSVMRITLNLQETNTLVSVKAKRGDTGRRLLIHLSDGSIPYPVADDCYAVFTARKSDGTIIHNPCTIENQVIAYTFTEQTCASPGTMHCEIRLYGSNRKLLTSACFLMTVFDTVYREGDEVSSEGEMTTLDALIADASELIATVEHKLNNGEFQGDDYTLTPEDKNEIAELAAKLLDLPEGSAGNSIYYMDFEADWPVPEAEIRYYMVQKVSLSNGGAGIKVGDVIAASNGTLCKVSGISGNTVYYDPIGTIAGGDVSGGFSPIATVTQTDSGAVISITDKDGETTATITNGKDGKDGVSAAHSWNGTVLTISSASGTSSADLRGTNGTSVTVSNVSESTASGGTNTVTFSDGKKVNIKNGTNGTNGKNPVKGTDYFTAEDKTEMVNAVIAALPKYNGGVS